MERIYGGGNRQQFIATTGRSGLIVSRTLGLLSLPDYVCDYCSNVEALTPYFVKRLAPRLGETGAEADDPPSRKSSDCG